MDGEFRGQAGGFGSGFRVGSRVAGYVLEEQIGAGGMAVVFRARDVRLARRVALKILAPALAADEVFRHRFTREAKAAAAVDDPHIIPVFETGEANGVLFIAMRYVPGGDARSLVRKVGPLPAQRAAGIVCSVASALDAAHAAGLVHRDVKPSNMLVQVRPGWPDHVYLADFGLSKDALSSSWPTGPGQFLGTVGYVAPEQAAGQVASGRADQYSLACSTFELLAGTPPFPRGSAQAVIWAHMSQQPPLLAPGRPDLPMPVDAVLARALAKAPEDRYASCRDFADALCAALNLAPHDKHAASSPRAPHEGAGLAGRRPRPVEKPRGSRSRLPAHRLPGARGSFQAAAAARKVETTVPSLATPPSKTRHPRGRAPRRDWRSRLVPSTAMAMAAMSAVLAAGLLASPATAHHTAPPVHSLLPLVRPARLVSLGVDLPGRPSYRPVADFAKAAGQPPTLAGYAAVWGEPFSASFPGTLVSHGVTPLVQIGLLDVSLPAIAAGDYDTYLRRYATAVRKFAHPIVMSFGHSMTTPGHPPGCGSAAARAFITAWRHIVTVFRHQGARNAAWMWAVSADRPSACPAGWGWPGESYVTWIRINGHYSRAHGKFASAFGRTIEQVRRFSRKPVILSVTSLGPSAGKFQRIVNMFTGLQRYSAYGLIWVAESQSPQRTATIDGSTVDTVAFRLGVSRLQPARFTRPSS